MEALADHALFNFSVVDEVLADHIQTIQDVLETAAEEDDFHHLVQEAVDVVHEYINSTPHLKVTFEYLLPSIQNLREEMMFYTSEPAMPKFDTPATDDEQGGTSPSSAEPMFIEAEVAVPAAMADGKPIRCNVCWGEESFVNDAIVICDECEVAVHESCYSINRIPDAEWLCNFCSFQKVTTKLDIVDQCSACHKRGGALVPSHNAQTWVHMACAIYLPELYFIHNKVEGIDKLKARRKLKCMFCKKSDNGACAQCAFGKCTTGYHVICAMENGISFHDIGKDGGSYASLCPSHQHQPASKKSTPVGSPEPALRATTPVDIVVEEPIKIETTKKTSDPTKIQESIQKWLADPSIVHSLPPTPAASQKPPSKPKAHLKKQQQHSTPPKVKQTTAAAPPQPFITPTKMAFAKPESLASARKTDVFQPFRPQAQVFVPAESHKTNDVVLLVLPQLPLGIDLSAQAPYVVDNITNPLLRSAVAKGLIKKGDELIAINNISLQDVTPTQLSQEIIPSLTGSIQCWLRRASAAPSDESTSMEWPWGYLRSDGKLAMVLVWQDMEELYFTCSKTSFGEVAQSDPESFEIPDVGTQLPLVVRDHRRALLKKAVQVQVVLPPLEEGATVQVAKRTWPGINKLGGTGRIKARHPIENGGFVYDVSYILGGSEKGIERQYITAVNEENPVTVAPETPEEADDERWTIYAEFTSPTNAPTEAATPETLHLKFEAMDDDTIVNLTPSSSEAAPIFKKFAVQSMAHEGFEGEDEILAEIQKCQTQLKVLEAQAADTFALFKREVDAETGKAYEKKLNRMMWKQYDQMYKDMLSLQESEDESAEEAEEEEEEDKLNPLFASIAESTTQVCAMCHVSGGDLAVTSCGKKAHIMCLIYTPETYIDNAMGYGLESITPERSRLVCDLCKKSTGVNKIQCCYKKCTKALHVQCAYVAGLLTTHPSFSGWCRKHFKLTDAATQQSVDLPPHMQKKRKHDDAMMEEDTITSTTPSKVAKPSPQAKPTPSTRPAKAVKSTVPAPMVQKAPRHLPHHIAPEVPPPVAEEEVPPVVIQDFNVGELVDVMPRLWTGSNKPGGVGRIKKKHEGDKYDIDYVLGSREKGVEAIYMTRYTVIDHTTASSTAEATPDETPKQQKRRRSLHAS
ncbi:Aste57867_23576 [Aphanomyces stellatus]|uniref:Aste57867_23576 protein n=1 Tax=Aphanomyces stellatus TaxID=120398 RepID=A0A485LN11_9STRA|nr:hypothetical protein As57867_023505 [Aphanomyces stellatus]VFU00221.1 Aste57867_23576 [Aphanomyces stellatus]